MFVFSKKGFAINKQKKKSRLFFNLAVDICSLKKA